MARHHPATIRHLTAQEYADIKSYDPAVIYVVDGRIQSIGSATNAAKVTVAARDMKDVEDVLSTYAAGRPSGETITIEMDPRKDYTATKPVTQNYASVSVKGNGATIHHEAVPGEFWTIDCVTSDTVGNIRSHRARNKSAMEDLTFYGPGQSVAGSASVVTNGTQDHVGVRAIIKRPVFMYAEAGFVQKDRSYLATIEDPSFYMMSVGLWTKAGWTDSGENNVMRGGVFDGVKLQVYLQGGGAWKLDDVSFDYSNQAVVMNGGLLYCVGCHMEPRGSMAAGDTTKHSVIYGYGADERAFVPGRDSYIDIAGDGAAFYWDDGVKDINATGATSSPYDFDHLIMLRDKTSRAFISDLFHRNSKNVGKKIWTGVGNCQIRNSALSTFPNLPERVTDQPRGNKLLDPNATDAVFEDLWVITKDTVSRGLPIELTGVAGTAQAITATGPTGLAYGAGQAFQFVPAANNTAADPVINISSLGNITIKSITGNSIGADVLVAGVKTQIVLESTTVARIVDNQRTLGANGRVERSTAAGNHVKSVTITAGGDYDTAPNVVFSGGGAAGTAIMSGRKVVGVKITDPGYNTGTGVTVSFTGGGGTGGAVGTVVFGGTGSWRVTKYGAAGTGFRVGVLSPVRPGEQVPSYGMVSRPSAGGMTGAHAVEMRYVKVKGFDGRGVPEIALIGNSTLYSASGAMPSDVTTPALATNKWGEYALKTYDSGAAGEAQAPEWATHVAEIYSFDSCTAGVCDLREITLGSL